MTSSNGDERQQIDQVIDRLSAKRNLPRQSVAEVVDTAYHHFEDRRIRDFVPLLVERRALRNLST